MKLCAYHHLSAPITTYQTGSVQYVIGREEAEERRQREKFQLRLVFHIKKGADKKFSNLFKASILDDLIWSPTC